MRCAKRSRFRSLDDDGPVVVERQHGPEDEVTYPGNVTLRLNELVSQVERVHGQAKEMMVQFVSGPNKSAMCAGVGFLMASTLTS